MARKTPLIHDDQLVYRQNGQVRALTVGTPTWYAWLLTNSIFAFHGDVGSFTARKERASNQRGSWYWKAYRKHHGKLYSTYLGKSQALTIEHLHAVAATLTKMHGANSGAAGRELAGGSSHERIAPESGELSHPVAVPAPSTIGAGEHEGVRGGSHLRLSHLPVPLIPILGRGQELAEVCTLLQQVDLRLLTLVGPGGVGKTLLALHLANTIHQSFTDGTCFIPLASITDPDLVLPTLTHALGLAERGTQSLFEQVKNALQGKHFLLLLDNFEQVVSAAPRLRELLDACPMLRIIVTSREKLHVDGEHVFLVPPLALPAVQRPLTRDDLAQNATVTLFLQRAQAVKPDFVLTEDNARAIAEICTRLDGLPLAIELAAARIRLLSPQKLLERLGHRLTVLTGGTREEAARQQTMRHTIGWSYVLLEQEEQRLFRRLAVFTGGCSLDAVEAVSNAVGDSGLDVMNVITALLDKHLLLQNEQMDGESRLMMLETIREYGLEALVASGEMDITRQAHALYYLHLLEEAEPHLDGPQQVMWLERLEREHDNIRTSLRWSREQGGTRGNWEIALRLAIALRRFWMMHGYWNEGRRFFEQALTESEGVVGLLRARALSAAATLADYQGDYRRGEALCQESLAIWRVLEDTRGMAFSIYRLASMSSERGNFSLARSLYEEALELFKEVGDQERISWALARLAGLESIQGEYTRARQLFEECLAHFRQLRNKEGVAWTLFNLAWALFVTQHDPAIVRSLLAESLVLCKELGARDSIASCLRYSGMVALHQGTMVAARSFLEESVALNREIGNRRALGQSYCGLASALALQGDLAAARALYEESLYLATEVDAKPVIVSALEGIAAVMATQQEPAAAAQLWGAAAALRDLMDIPMPPIEYAASNRSMTSVRIRLGKQAFTTAWTKGRTRVQEQIVSISEPITALTPSVVWLPLLSPMRFSPPHSNELTKREIEVLRLLATGLTSAQIAEYLTISVLTVNSHVRSIYSKLGVTSRSAATRFALEQKLV